MNKINVMATSKVQDVKTEGNGTMFQKQLSNQDTASSPSDAEYVFIKKYRELLQAETEAKTRKSSKKDDCNTTAVVTNKRSVNANARKDKSTDTGGESASIPASPTVISNPTERDIIRSALLSRMHGGSKSTALYRKHVYTVVQSAPTSGTEAGSVLNVVALGSAYNQRVGTQVKFKKLILRVHVYFYHNSASFTANAVYPAVIRFVLKRDVVPTTPGTTTASFAQDANPPGSAVAPFSGLGDDPTANADILRISVFNPASVGTFHVYRDISLPQASANHMSTQASTETTAQILATGQTYSLTPHLHTFEWEVDLDFISTYVVGGANPVTNALELTNLSVYTATQAIGYSYTADLEFEDVVTN